MNKILEKQLGFWREFAICLAIALISRGTMFFGINLSADDYGFLNFSEKVEIWPFAVELRVFAFILIIILNLLGASPPFVGFLWSVIFNIGFVVFGLLAMQMLVPKSGSIAKIAGVCLFLLFPYHSDYLSYCIAAPTISTMLIIGICSMYFCLISRKIWWLCLFGMTYAVSGQITFVYLFMVVIFGFLIWVFQAIGEGALAKSGFLKIAKPWFIRLGTLLLGAILYLAVNKIIILFLGMNSGSRLVFADLDGIKENIIMAAKQVYYFFFKADVVQPLSVKILQFGFFGAVFFAGLQLSLRKSRVNLKLLFLWLLAMGFVFLSMLFIMGAVFPLKEPPLNPRTLSALGVYWAGVFALAVSITSGRLQRAAIWLGVFVAFCYAINSNRQALDFARINERDRFVASRMVERLSLLEGFPNLRTVVLTNTHHTFNLDRISTESSGFNISSLYRNWSSVAVLREVSGTPFTLPTEDDRKLAENLAQVKPEWPAPGSVFIEGDVGVVVLPKREKLNPQEPNP
jgi:hypothetical protein